MSEPSSQLIDVRTKAELHLAQRAIIRLMQMFPYDGVRQPDVEEFNNQMKFEIENILKELDFNSDNTLFFMCRSGARSSNAAKLMTSIGWDNSYNVLYGFEGDPDLSHKRGITNGWKCEGLPWIQQ